MAVITLTTDFGVSDHYVGLMKGVILGIAPGAELVDITHEIRPQDVMAGALTIEPLPTYFPAGSIHVVVVDPGVGTERRPIAARVGDHVFVGPDNGVFSFVLPSVPPDGPIDSPTDSPPDSPIEAVTLDHPGYHRRPVSQTFHGRDIFSPVAAHLASGTALGSLGSALAHESLCRLATTMPLETDTGLELHVLHIDHFGNLITDLQRSRPAAAELIAGRLRARGIPFAQTFGDVEPHSPVCYFGSTGRLEIAIRNGNASCTMGLTAGDPIACDRV